MSKQKNKLKRTDKNLRFGKKLIIPVSVLVAAGMITLGAMSTNAYFHGGEQQDVLVKKLSERLGADETKIRSVFDELRTEKQKEMEAKFLDRLNQAVSSGKITEAQKSVILAKHKELQAIREKELEAFKNVTPEQRREKRQSEKADLEAWAKTQGIDLKLFFGPMGQGGRMGKGMMY